MDAINRILVALDPHLEPSAKAQPAISKGYRLAKDLGAELHFGLIQYAQHLAASRFGNPQDTEQAREKFLATWQQWLDRCVGDCARKHGDDVKVSTELDWDSPWHDGIIRQAVRVRADLVIKDIHHHPRWGKSLFTNTDWHLVRECPTALLMLKSGHWHAPPRFLAAVDPMHERDKPAALDQRILDHAQLISGPTGANLKVFHSYVPALNLIPVEAGGIPMDLPFEQSVESIERAHREALDALLEKRDIAPEDVIMEPGQPADALLARIEEDHIDLVVMGAVARNALKRLFLGSTAERIFSELGADLLIVKPEDFSCPVDLNP
jgi:universal stress protein E